MLDKLNLSLQHYTNADIIPPKFLSSLYFSAYFLNFEKLQLSKLSEGSDSCHTSFK